jgi:hypothetical protein
MIILVEFAKKGVAMSTEPITIESIMRVFDKIAADRAEEKKCRDVEYAEEKKRRDEEYAEEKKRRDEEYTERKKRRDEEYAEEKKRLAEQARLQAEWNTEFRKNMRESIARLDKQERRMKHFDERYGGLSKNIGTVVEYFFQKALRHEMVFGGIRYNRMTPNVKPLSSGELQGEFDIVLHNGKFTGLIEVKHVFARHHLHDFINRIVPNFHELCPEYTDGKTLYLGIASWAFEDGVVEEAKSLGIGILQRDGKKSIIIDDAHLKAY